MYCHVMQVGKAMAVDRGDTGRARSGLPDPDLNFLFALAAPPTGFGLLGSGME